MYERLVEKGMALLDEKRPGWEDEIDLKSLDIVSGVDCILGQLYNHYSYGLTVLSMTTQKASEYGFDSPNELVGSLSSGFKSKLTEMWTYKILLRRGMNKLLNQEPALEIVG